MSGKVKVEVKWVAERSLLEHPLRAIRSDVTVIRVIAGTVAEDSTLHSKGSRVIGILEPTDVEEVTQFLDCPVNLLSPIAPEVSPSEAVLVLLPALATYTAIHYQAKIKPNDSCLILASEDALAACVTAEICLANKLNVLVFAKTRESEGVLKDCIGKDRVERLDPYKQNQIVSLAQSFGDKRGFHLILDLRTLEEESRDLTELVGIVGGFGDIVSRESGLDISPSLSAVLHLKGASLHFLNELIWILVPEMLGKYQHILRDIMEKLRSREIRLKDAGTGWSERADGVHVRPIPP